MELDTGSGRSILNKPTFRRLLGATQLSKKSGLTLQSYSGHKCELEGSIMAEASYMGTRRSIEILIVWFETGNLLGKDFMKTFDLEVKSVSMIQNIPVGKVKPPVRRMNGAAVGTSDGQMVLGLLSAFPRLFPDSSGKATGVPAQAKTLPYHLDPIGSKSDRWCAPKRFDDFRKAI